MPMASQRILRLSLVAIMAIVATMIPAAVSLPAAAAEVTVEQLMTVRARELRPNLVPRAVLKDKEVNAGQRAAIKRMQPRLQIKAVISNVETGDAMREAAKKQRQKLRKSAAGRR